MSLEEFENIVGKIKSISVQQFVTYEECVFYPTKYLNVIIGPNGTGKSTLVAAIVIGLGGSPKLLSKATSIKDYIKNARDKSTITVEIFSNEDEKTVFFKRSFDASGKSEFWINEDKVSLKKYLQEVSTYNIQINNLCQFLPQDRVQDFARMNPQEIFNNTITSVCSPEIQDKCTELKDLRKLQTTSKKKLPRELQKYKELLARNEELRSVLEKMNAKKKLIENLKVYKAKKAWKEVEELQKKIDDTTNDLQAAEQLVDLHNQMHSNIVERQGAIISRTKQLNTDIDNNVKKLNSILTKIDNITKELDKSKQQINTFKHDYETTKNDSIERTYELQNETRILEALLQDFKEAAVPDTKNDIQKYEERLNQIKVEISSLISKRTGINKQIDEENDTAIPLKSRIERFENIREQKLQLLKNSHSDVYHAVQWLRKNLDKFEAKVYEPRILELNVPDPNDAKYFENVIPMRDLMAFTFESKTDMTQFIRIMRSEQNLMINAQYSKPARECEYKPNKDISSYEKFGFRNYLINLIQGPPAILNSLCSLFHLEKILVGSDEVNQYVDSIPQHIRSYFGGDQRYSVAISKYSREPSVMQSIIKDKHLLSSVDANSLNNLKEQLKKRLRNIDLLKNERTTVEVKTRELEVQRSDILKEQRAIEVKMARQKNFHEKCKQQKHKVTQLKQLIIDIPKLEQNFKNNVKNEIKKLISLHKTKVLTLKKYQQVISEKKQSACKLQVYQIENEPVTRLVNEATEALEEKINQTNTIKLVIENTKKGYILKKNEAKHITNGFKPKDSAFPYKEEFKELPNNIDEIATAMNEISGRLECLADADQDVIDEYEKRSADIEILKNSIEESRNQDQKLENDIKNIYTVWITEILHVVDDINKHFSNFMKSMRYAGEVLLSKNEDYDFDSYGIQIMVQYRSNVPLQPLDRHVQSGGERAVAIAVYSLSLQHLTTVPFRCVDEINQGMDPTNERKVFDMLVDETSKVGRSQYFFVTPKLLPNLNFNNNMSIHIVFNGELVKGKDAFN